VTRRGAIPPDLAPPDDLDAVEAAEREDTEAADVPGSAAEPGPDGDGTAQAPDEPALLRGRGLAGLVALAAVVLLLLAVAITAGVMWNSGRTTDSGRENALSAARQTAVNLTTIDFTHAEADVQRVVDGATGDFGGLFTQNLDSYVGVVKEGQVVTTGQVTEAGIEKYDGKTASAVVAVKTTVTNQTVPDGEQRFYRLVEQMENHDGHWLVSRVEFVP
jgi:Mce-associated membrane protein